jgi:hypothetical protein
MFQLLLNLSSVSMSDYRSLQTAFKKSQFSQKNLVFIWYTKVVEFLCENFMGFFFFFLTKAYLSNECINIVMG